MPPLIAAPAGPAQIAFEWEKLKKKLSNSPRALEFNSSKNVTIANTSIKYYEMKLDQKSAIYNQIVNDAKGQQALVDALTTMKYTREVIGSPGASGYPVYIVLHGGGNAKTVENDIQWRNMTIFYKQQIRNGIHVAIRGLGDTWDLNFTAAFHLLLERLVENLILFGNADSNRIALLGFSAGGDGVYRLAPRLAQRFRAANMGGGHPGDAKFGNLMNLPICLQIGERDTSYERSKMTADSGVKLDVLKAKYTGRTTYEHDVYIHPNASADYLTAHWWWENSNASWPSPDLPRQNVPIVWDWRNWLTQYPNLAPAFNIKQENTNAIDWLSQDKRVRNPMPAQVYWDLSDWGNFSSKVHQNFSGRGQDDTGRTQNYWLDIGKYTRDEVGDIIEVSIERDFNTINVLSAKKYLRLLLRDGMLDLKWSVFVKIGGQSLTVSVNTDNLAVVQDTIWRCDPNLIFTADVILTQGSNGVWTGTSTPRPAQNIDTNMPGWEQWKDAWPVKAKL